MLFFLPEETRGELQGTWMRIFGDVTKISDTFQFNWATIFQVIAIILMMIVLTTVISFILDHVHPKSPKAKSAVTLFRSAIKYITFIVGFFWCLGALGVNLSTIFASVGIVALIIGFGAQSLVEDLVTGIFLVFEDQFNVGDIIEVNGFRGTVESIGIRTTAIKDVGNNVKIINNSDLRNILNRSTADSFAVTTVSVSYSTDLEKAEKVIAELLPKIREKYPDIFVAVPKYSGVQELADSGVILKFVAEVREQNVFSAPRILNRELKIGFDKAGIEIPFNQIVVHQAKD
ncbi:MAG: mechanosensitive ion channel family protein [Oscillospiraceae bacterium]|nr:mechanosensitive ion channel family protein [Oscillospiraceae bacterium]